MWCLNSCLLAEQEYRKCIINCLMFEKKNPFYEKNICAWWGMVKNKIKMKNISYAKKRSFLRKQKELELRENLKKEEEIIEGDLNHDRAKLIQLQSDLENLEKEKCRGAITRSKGKYVVEGEKCIKFFLNLEGKN